MNVGMHTEEDGGVDGHVPADADTHGSQQRCECHKVRRATRGEPKGARDQKRDIERPAVQSFSSVFWT